MFRIRIGITRMKMKTARAAPTPNWFSPENDFRHISNASTVASFRVEPGAIASTMSKTFSTPMICVMKTTESTGARSGTVARDRRKPGADDDHRKAGGGPEVGDDERRRDQARPEPVDAAERRGERRARHAQLVGAAANVREGERPVRGGLRRADLVARAREQIDGRSRHTDLALFDLTRLPAARLEVAPDDTRDTALERLGLDSLLAVLGDLVRRDRRQSEKARVASAQLRVQGVSLADRALEVRGRRVRVRDNAGIAGKRVPHDPGHVVDRTDR